MKTQPKGPSDSLELLLDTVCNSLGSMILITLLIVVSTNDLQERLVPENPNELAAAQAQAVSINQQIKAVELETEKLRANALGLPALNAEISELKIKATSIKEVSKAAPNPVMKRLEIANRTLQESRRDIESKNNELAALESAKQKHLNAQTQQVRLPSRQTSTKKAILVFVANGKFFPQTINGKISQHIDIEILRVRPLKASLAPDLNKGLYLSEFKDFLRTVDVERERIGLLVYGSGFEVFMQAQQACADHGLECGWEPLDKDSIMTIGGSGGGISVDPQ